MTPRHRPTTAAGVFAAARRYVYQGRRRLSAMISPHPRITRTEVLGGAIAAATVVLLASTFALDGDAPPETADLAAPTPPPPVQITAEARIGSAPPGPSASTAAPDRTPPRSPTVPVVPPPRPDPPRTVYYEAESALLLGAAEVLGAAGASGGRIVHNIGTAQDGRSGEVAFTRVTAATAGRYALTIDYVSGENREAFLSINNGRSQRLGFPAGRGWDDVASRTFTIDLAAGQNTLLLSNPVYFAPRLDRISILG